MRETTKARWTKADAILYFNHLRRSSNRIQKRKIIDVPQAENWRIFTQSQADQEAR